MSCFIYDDKIVISTWNTTTYRKTYIDSLKSFIKLLETDPEIKYRIIEKEIN